MLREEAEQKVGGATNLDNMVDKGAVKVSEHDQGHEMYFFPRARFGQKITFTDSLTVSKSKQTDDNTYKTISGAFGNLNWAIKSTQQQLDASLAAFITHVYVKLL